MKKLLPVLLAIVGLVGGAAAGWLMKPAPEGEAAPCLDAHGNPAPPETCAAAEADRLGEPYEVAVIDPKDASEFITLDRQFIVPVVTEDQVASMMVLTLSLEVAPGHVEDVLSREPKVRDALLRTLFEHAYTGGFTGDFTAENVMRDLRRNLLISARKVAGPDVRDVLVVDILRQDQ